jgi:hypothetical protein
MKTLNRMACLGCLLAATSAGVAHAQGETTGWFVLRQEKAGACTTALLSDADGGYHHSRNWLVAGGPFDTEQQALDRIKTLQLNGTCAGPN